MTVWPSEDLGVGGSEASLQIGDDDSKLDGPAMRAMLLSLAVAGDIEPTGAVCDLCNIPGLGKRSRGMATVPAFGEG